MIEHQRRPRRLRDDRIEKRDHALPAVEYCELHRQARRAENLHADAFVFLHPLLVVFIHGARLVQQPAGDTAQARLLDKLFIERIDRVGGPRKLKVIGLHFGKHPPVLGGDLRRFANDPKVVERPASALPFRIRASQIVDKRPGESRLLRQFLLYRLPRAAPDSSGIASEGSTAEKSFVFSWMTCANPFSIRLSSTS